MDEITRRCWRCQCVKPIVDFGKNKSRPDGINPTCKLCARELYRERYYKDLDKARAYDKSQRLKTPEKHRESVRRHRAQNLERERSYDSWYAKTHKEAIRAKGHRREARRRSRPVAFNAKHWETCLTYWQHCCAYCGRQASGPKTGAITGDHWIPLVDPNCPGTIPSNMIPACYSCNSRKQDSDPLKWLNSTFGSEVAAQIAKRVSQYFEWLQHNS